MIATTDSKSADNLIVNRQELLKFLDEKPDSSIGHVSSLVAVIGEDLNSALFLHYAESCGDQAKIVQRLDKAGEDIGPHPVTTGRQRGPRLDRWIEVKPTNGGRFLYQTEIKNWSSTAIGGETLAATAKPRELAAYRQRRWERHWDSVRKTLIRCRHR